MILLLDNYDSFVYNLDRYLQRLGQQTLVVRSDAMSVDSIAKLGAEAIVISPGPKTPDEAGCSVEVIRRLGDRIPILGVCLGHQAIGQAYGGHILRAASPVHGKASWIDHNGQGVFSGLSSPLKVARYHSLVVDESSLPKELQVSARSDDQAVMAVQHATHPVVGVQFHPESILTDNGYQMLANFLQMHGIHCSQIPENDLTTPDR